MYKLNNILFFLSVIFILYGLFEIRKIKKNVNKENLDSLNNLKALSEKQKHEVYQLISSAYQADIESIRNLSNIATQLQKGGLTVAGNLKVTGNIDTKGKFNYLPKGVIMAYNSPKAPPGWAICDGKNGTPDLRGRFIRMHTNGLRFGGDGNSYIGVNLKGSYQSNYGGLRWADPKVWRLRQNFGSYGGSDITVQDISQMARHTHGCRGAGNHSHSIHTGSRGGCTPAGRVTQWNQCSDNGFKGGIIANAGNHAHGIIPTGNGNKMNNQPSYYVLTWIMKL